MRSVNEPSCKGVIFCLHRSLTSKTPCTPYFSQDMFQVVICSHVSECFLYIAWRQVSLCKDTANGYEGIHQANGYTQFTTAIYNVYTQFAG